MLQTAILRLSLPLHVCVACACRLLGITHFVQFDCSEPWKMSPVPNVKWTAYANVALLVCLYFMLAIELRRSHYKVCIKMPHFVYMVLWKQLKGSAPITLCREFVSACAPQECSIVSVLCPDLTASSVCVFFVSFIKSF